VVARDLSKGRPVLFALESPRRVGFFLHEDALLSPEGRLLLAAAADWVASAGAADA
jgi:hypothetical protein